MLPPAQMRTTAPLRDTALEIQRHFGPILGADGGFEEILRNIVRELPALHVSGERGSGEKEDYSAHGIAPSHLSQRRKDAKKTQLLRLRLQLSDN